MRMRLKLLPVLLLLSLLSSLSIAAQTTVNYAVVRGTVAEVQKYGNLTMDIAPADLYKAGYELGDLLTVTVGDRKIDAPFCTSYSDVDTGSPLVRDDQAGKLLVVAINMGNFSKTYGALAGSKVSFAMKEKGGFLAEYLLHQLKRSNKRSDYASDSVYANFRGIATAGIPVGVLYRSSNPANNELNRASYADALARSVGVKTVINLSDSKESLEGYFATKDFNSFYYKALYDAGQVKCLNMGVDLSSEEFGKKLADGLRFLISHEGPYLIHCTEGKDRAGFVSAVLESLMGASLEQVSADYMLTYSNYYGVEKGSEKYTAIAASNIVASLTTIVCGYAKGTDLRSVDLAARAESYLIKCGLTGGEVAALKAKLSAVPSLKAPTMTGTVGSIEKYGHAVTNILIKDFLDRGFKFGDTVTVIFSNGYTMDAPFLDGYYVNSGDPLVRAYPGQTNIAVCVNYGKLNKIADVKPGDTVTLMLDQPRGYLTQYEIRKLKRTNNRSDYPSDEVFANFRQESFGKVAPSVLYRSSSPIDPQLGRAKYADRLIKAAGVKTVIDLSDSTAEIEAFLASPTFDSPYYGSLYKSGSVLSLNMNLAYASDDFRKKIAEGCAFMAARPGPYLFHCTEGKDRTGFLGALLGSLMGATQEEITRDYMRSYADFYGVEQGSEKYRVISADVLEMLKVIAGTGDLKGADLEAGAKKYLLAGGMTSAQVDDLKLKLSGKM